MQTQFMDESARRQLKELQALETATIALMDLEPDAIARVLNQLNDWIYRVKSPVVHAGLRALNDGRLKCGESNNVKI